MEISQLQPTDAYKYRNLRLNALKNNPEAFGSSFEEEKDIPLKTFESRLASDVSFTFGAFENGELIGSVTLVIEKKIKLKHRATIFAMYVSPEHRSLGIGHALMAEAINKAKELDEIEQIYLSVVSTNHHARKLYTKLGFEKIGDEKRSLKISNEYFDQVHMVLFL